MEVCRALAVIVCPCCLPHGVEGLSHPLKYPWMTKYPTTMTFLEAMRSAQLDLREISKLRATLTRTEQERLGFMCPPPSRTASFSPTSTSSRRNPTSESAWANQRRSCPP
jgi:hypothetical protein